MAAETPTEKEVWGKLKGFIGSGQKILGPGMSKALFADPKYFGKQLFRYKFIAKMLSKGKNILELGCGEAMGSPILSEESLQYLGVDENATSIEYASKNWGNKKCSFIHDSFLGKKIGCFDALVCLDISPQAALFETIQTNLHEDGLCAYGVKNDHENVSEVLSGMELLFHNVITFRVNGTAIQNDDSLPADNLLFLGCYKR